MSQDPVYKFGDVLIVDQLAAVNPASRAQALRQDVSALESQIKQLQEAVDSLRRLQQRSLDNSLFNKANELQEDISMKVFDLQVAHIHLRAVKSQTQVFPWPPGWTYRRCVVQLELLKTTGGVPADTVSDRKVATASSGGMKNRWLKAFSSLKKSSPAPDKNDADKKNSTSKGLRPLSISSTTLESTSTQHVFQEYTYKKVTACDVCREILKGHTRQGLKCKLCKVNIHSGCQEKIGACQPKTRLLRRQRSTSDLETKLQAAAAMEDEDPYNGRQFVSGEFEQFTKMNGIRHTKTSPYNPSTNGLAERYVREFKNLLRNNNGKDDLETNPQRFLFAHRAFPQTVIKEFPAELLMKRSLRSRFSNLIPRWEIRESRTKVWNLGLTRISGVFSSEQCKYVIGVKLLEFGIDFETDIVCVTTDGCAMMVKLGHIIGPLQQLCYAYGLHLAVMDVLYAKKKERVFPEFVSATVNEAESDLSEDDNEDTSPFNVSLEVAHPSFPEAIYPQSPVFSKKNINEVTKKARVVVKLFKRSPLKNEILLNYMRQDNRISTVLQYLHNPQAQLEKKKMVKDFSVKLLLRLKPLQEQMAEFLPTILNLQTLLSWLYNCCDSVVVFEFPESKF
ncbi:hypothetical protein LAZ67_6003260 [Cordylochernes scorpioides]|uniref:Phorbol-ester/DAG-type domain-containing protein n=1 Tax=Cordylochernes scorpioides TaxID=51811 RepID=A0ABY6KMB4_9ARAC|nr:hypothetical protein LAZ67_6003260 [Cordylochernes scorpioides]